jgi:plasmid stability protein
MRTTIRLDDALLREAKARAAKAGRSLNDFIEEAVRLAVLAPTTTPDAVVDLPVFRGGQGVRPGVNLDSGAALLDVMSDSDKLA